MNYRFDKRTKQEFRRDIKIASQIENKIIELWLDRIEKRRGERPKYWHIGCNNDGSYLEDHEVSTEADYCVYGYGKIEIKFSKPMITKCFHLKVNQVRSYIRQNANILMVNGWNTPNPMFVLIRVHVLKSGIKRWKRVSFHGCGNKPCFRIPVDEFIWRPLNG